MIALQCRLPVFRYIQWFVVNHCHWSGTEDRSGSGAETTFAKYDNLLDSPPIKQLFSPAKTNPFYTIAQFCLFWRKTTMSVVGGSLFQRGPGPDVYKLPSLFE